MYVIICLLINIHQNALPITVTEWIDNTCKMLPFHYIAQALTAESISFDTHQIIKYLQSYRNIIFI